MENSKSGVPKLTRTQLYAVTAGNAFEYYDFVVFAFAATEIGSHFFTGDDPTASLLKTFALFAVAYFFRPVGGFITGTLGDRYGRKPVLTTLILLTGLASAVIGVLPTYSQIGIFAPLLLTVIRVIQGIAVGGEYGGGATYIAESTLPHERGRYISRVPQSSYIGLLVASLVLLALRTQMNPAAFHEWGWRIPFFLALPTAIVAVWMRMKLDESTEFVKLRDAGEIEKNPLRNSLRHDWRSILVVMGLMVQMSVGGYVLSIYLQSYLSRVGILTAGEAQWAISILLTAVIISMPYAGRLSDYFGRRSTMFVSLALLVVLPAPAFMIMSTSGFGVALVVASILAVLTAAYGVVALASITEVFTTARRLSGLNIGYNVGIAIFAGPAPFLATLLVKMTGDKIAPSYLVIGAAVISFLTVLFAVKETAPRVMDRGQRRNTEIQARRAS
jgi:MHS family proline/betaine transporter-like MFS transporter